VRAADTHRIVFMDLKLPKMGLNILLLITMGIVIFFVENETIYYIALGGLFTVILAFNFRAGIRAVRMVLKKEVIE